MPGASSGLPLALAGFGALGYGSASALQAFAARRQRGTLHTIGHPAYLLGTSLDLLAWLCSLIALRNLPVFEVQGVLAGSLAVAALATRLLLRTRLGRPGVLAVGLSAIALVALAASAGVEHPVVLGTGRRALLALSVLPIAGIGWSFARAHRAQACAAAAGLAFGGAALCARAVQLHQHPLTELSATVTGVLTDPLAWGLAGFGITGMLLYAAALEHGDPMRTTAMLWLAEVAVPSAVGVGLLGDTVRPGRGPVAISALVVGLLAGWLLTQGRPVGQRVDQPT